MVKKKVIIQQVPESIVTQAQHVLQSKNYSSAYRKEMVRVIVGTCAVCDGIPNKYIIDTQDDAEIITRYCDKDYIKYQKYNKKKKVK